PEAQPGDRSAGAAVLLLTASTALFLNGIFQLLRVVPPKLPIVLDNGSLVTTSVLLGLACTVALLALCVVLLRKTSRVHVVAMELLVTGTFGCITTSYGALRHVNADVDGVQPMLVEVPAWGARSYRCGKGGRSTCYQVNLGGNGAEIKPWTHAIDSGEYHQFLYSYAARLTIYPGKLGYRWLARVEPIVAYDPAQDE
ncbi:MAG TPA: hypothetical protein VM686_41710, partial [Polyangiaceae bacterium]|nr:hypothetical protein [Polyangiaceae bacterium]